jgi:hypothetical protein
MYLLGKSIMAYVDFYTYNVKDKCSYCYWGKSKYHPQCTCDNIYVLNRMRVIFDDHVTKDTVFTFSIEDKRDVLSTDYYNVESIPIQNAQIFNMLCNTDSTPDDETTSFEPYVKFIEHFFGIYFEGLVEDIIFAKKTSKGKDIEKNQYLMKIDKIQQKFIDQAFSLCHYSSHKHIKVINMILSKIFHLLVLIRIDSLFDQEHKENPHVSKKKKKTKWLT